ncbi:MAG: mannose-1-phosphate guanylyltransferase/mannose-6-phosphate isomerase, partial [Firmicutes bacterium]|nr:mannose-1-phosphate guanylyltransferase/mannose-6-phosphate isomerase [Bacillota bacterium]
PAEFDWSDLGNYHQLSALLGEDEHHNVVRGDCVLRNVSNSVIISDRKLTAVIGVKDLVIIENQGILLVCRADKTEEIRDVVNTLNESRFGYR